MRVRRRTDGLSSFGELECEKETWLAAAVVQERQNNPFPFIYFWAKPFPFIYAQPKYYWAMNLMESITEVGPILLLDLFYPFIYLCPTNTRCLRTHFPVRFVSVSLARMGYARVRVRWPGRLQAYAWPSSTAPCILNYISRLGTLAFHKIYIVSIYTIYLFWISIYIKVHRWSHIPRKTRTTYNLGHRLTTATSIQRQMDQGWNQVVRKNNYSLCPKMREIDGSKM